MKKKWIQGIVIAMTILFFMLLGGFGHFFTKAKSTQALEQTLLSLEKGMIPEESSDFKARLEPALKAEPFKFQLGGYTNTTVANGITYNTALVFKADGTYEYAMNVGSDRVYKTYKHAGRWWTQGRVLHTVLLAGDAFLVSPSSRDKATPSRELIIDASDSHMSLQAPYSRTPVRFEKSDDAAVSKALNASEPGQ